MSITDKLVERLHAWADQFLASPTDAMSETTSSILVRLYMADKETVHRIIAASNDFAVKVTQKRASWAGLEADPAVILFVSTIVDTPGEAVMWVHALRSWQMRNAGQRLTLEVLCTKLFPFGFPTKDALQKAWEAQKTTAGNLLDYCGSTAPQRQAA